MTAKERVFIGAYARTGDGPYAGEKAEFAQPARDAGRLLARPAVQQEIVRHQVARLNNELLPLAIDTLFDILTSDKATDRARLAATAIVIKGTIGAAVEASAGKEPHEMSSDELQQRIADLRREAADRAKPVVDLEPAESGVFD